MTQVTHRQKCRLCDSPRLELVVKLQDIPLAEMYTTPGEADDHNQWFPVDLHMCLDCGHVQQLAVIDSELLWGNYTYSTAQSKGMVEHFEQVADRIVKEYQPPPGSLVVDVGSNDGSLLRPFKQRGFKVLGIDPAREIARKATESGIETWPELFSTDLAVKIKAQYGPAAVVTAFNVFAHSDDMTGMAEGIRRLLAPQGVFVFEVQYLLDVIDRVLLGTIFHEHMSHHSLRPMTRFLDRHGMQLIDVERVPIQHGSIIGTAQLKGGLRTPKPAVAELLALEADRKLDLPETIRQFGARLAELKAKMQAIVADCRRQGKTIAAYGAARSGPTYIVQLGLGDALAYILDDHPQKVNKLSPGHRIPVYPTAELHHRMPDYVVILAWVHTKNIIANNRKYLEQGGHFVTCCPDVQVVDANTPL